MLFELEYEGPSTILFTKNISAGPLFTGQDRDNRLDARDALYVEAIHTNCNMFGFAAPLATTDFYPNSGYIQPNCGICCNINSHSRAIDLFVESLLNNNFDAKLCPIDIDITRNKGADLIKQCDGPLNAKLGGEPGNRKNVKVFGIYFLETNQLSFSDWFSDWFSFVFY